MFRGVSTEIFAANALGRSEREAKICLMIGVTWSWLAKGEGEKQFETKIAGGSRVHDVILRSLRRILSRYRISPFWTMQHWVLICTNAAFVWALKDSRFDLSQVQEP